MPALDDDGHTVTLDLHGATVVEATNLALAVLAEAAARGRKQVRLIHGHSTSHQLYRNRTIKHRLYEMMDQGAFAEWVTDALRREGHLLLSLDVTREPNAERIRLGDIQ